MKLHVGMLGLLVACGGTPGGPGSSPINGLSTLKFATVVRTALPGTANAIVAGHFDGDSTMDLAVAYGNESSTAAISVYRGRGDGSFELYQSAPTGPSAEAAAITDINHDGIDDILVINYTGGTLDVLTSGVNQYTFNRLPLPMPNPVALVVGDVDEDGNDDCVISYGGSFPGVTVMLGQGNGQYMQGATFHFDFAHAPGVLLLIDLDGDHHADLVVTGDKEPGFEIHRGHGDGTFAPPEAMGLNYYSKTVVSGDFDGDGRIDLVFSHPYDGKISYLRGGVVGLSTPEYYPFGNQTPVAMVAADLDSDHVGDIVALPDPGWNGGAGGVFLGKGGGTLAGPRDVDLGEHPIRIIAADLDADGRKDLVVINGTEDFGVVMNTSE